jgi:membrane dipeptidase
MIVIDSHLDISWNALNWNRDLNMTVAQIRAAEAAINEKGRGTNTVSLPELRKGEVAVCLATVLARAKPRGDSQLDYRTQEIACAMARGQLAYYRLLEKAGKVRMIGDWRTLFRHMDEWQAAPDTTPLGFILAMEGADPIVSPDQAAEWRADGLRVVGLAHYGPSAYAHGTASSGGLTERGRDLLHNMERLGMVLDATHLADESFFEALELFRGPVLASHNNCRALVPGDRQFSDAQIELLIERDAVIGAAFDNWMLAPGWTPRTAAELNVTMENVVDHIDRVCQIAGTSRHSAIGSDLDGGYGTEQSPADLDTIVDLQKIPNLLRKRGYREADIAAIMHGNWIRFFEGAWK